MNAIDGLILFFVIIAGLCYLGKVVILIRMLFGRSTPRQDDAEVIARRAIRKASRHEQ